MGIVDGMVSGCKFQGEKMLPSEVLIILPILD